MTDDDGADEEPTEQEILLEIYRQLDGIHRDLRPVTFLAWLSLIGLAVWAIGAIVRIATA